MADSGLIPTAKKDPNLMAPIMVGAFDFVCYSQIIGLTKLSLDDIMDFSAGVFFRTGA